MSRLKQLIREIHRHSAWQVLGIYLVGGWLVLQVVDTLAGALNLPPWAPSLALFLLIIGLPIVVATAVIQRSAPPRAMTDAGGELSSSEAPSGAERPEARAGWQPPTGARRLLSWRNALLGGVAAFALLGIVTAGWVLLGLGNTGVGSEASISGGKAVVAGAGGARGSRGEYAASVAVMPFDNLGGADEGNLSDGFTEEVIAQLARIEGLKVISRTSVVALRGTNLSLPQIGDTLGVEHVLVGSIREADDQLRVTVELLAAATDAILWADTYTRPKENIFDLQDEIAGRVSSALVENVAQLSQIGRASRTTHTDAYEAYLRARRAIHARTEEALEQAIAGFREAVKIDPSFAPAYAGLSSAYGLSITYGYDLDLGPYERFASALDLASTALELDPELAEAYGARSYVATKAGAPATQVLADFERAVELRPNSADMRGWYAHILARAGRHAEALAQAQRAIELDPIAPGRRIGFALDAIAAREYALALDEARNALALQPSLTLPKVLIAYTLLLLERPEECLRQDLEGLAAVRALCLHSAGREEEAAAAIDSVARIAREAAASRAMSDITRSQLAEDLAIYFAWIGDSAASLEWHDHAFVLSPNGVDFRLYDGGLFDRVRESPAHEARVAEIWRTAWARVSEDR
jgi:serine/threonine-protein kinase